MRLHLGACALAAVAAACGGDDALSAAEFRERSAAICRAADRALVDAAAERTPGNEGAFWREVEAIEAELDAGFRELDLSNELRRGVDEWLEAGSEVIDVSRLASSADVIGNEEARADAQRRLAEATRAAQEAEEGLPLASECTDES